VIAREDTEEPLKRLLSLYALPKTAMLQWKKSIMRKQRQSLSKQACQCSLQLETFKDGKIHGTKRTWQRRRPGSYCTKDQLCAYRRFSLVLGNLCVAEDAAFLGTRLRHHCSECLPLLGLITALATQLISPLGFS
jgi:hypothetical protein